MSKRREQIKSRWISALEKASDRAQTAFEAEVSRTVADWNKRFPRHRFSAYVGHGMLSVECDPPFCGQANPQWWHHPRLAAAVVKSEVQALIDWHCDMEIRVAVGGDCGPIDGTELQS